MQGFPIDRTIYLVPPPEAAYSKSKLWKLNTAVYGLCDASRSWYLKVSQELLNKGATKSMYDNALFCWRASDKLQGIICCHVDDFFFAGSQLFHERVIDHLRQTFKLSNESSNQMLYTGIEIIQSEHQITMHQNNYVKRIEPLEFEDMTKNRRLTTVETRSFKTLVGQLQWASKQTRPNIAFAACDLSTRMKEATTNDVKQANKQLQKLQSESNIICIPDLEDITQTTLILYSDALHANLSNCTSQGGFVTFLCGKNGKSSSLVWTSHKLKRVVKSSMAAEMSMLEGAEWYAVLLKALITEIYALDDTQIPITCIIDNKSLSDAVASTKIIVKRINAYI